MSLLGTTGWTVCFVFCGRISSACMYLLNRVSSMHLIGFMLHATKKERKSAIKHLMYCVFQDAQGSASERNYTAAGGDIQVPYGGIDEWRKSEQRLIHGLVKQMQFCANFIDPWLRNGSFQRPRCFQFLNRSLFRSSPVVMNHRWRLREYCEKNKRQGWDICEEFSVWHFVTNSTGLKSVKPRM